MRTKDTILLEQAYDRVVLRNQMLNEDVINDLTSKVWNTFKQKFPQVTQGINQAVLILFKNKNLQGAGDVIAQSLASNKTPVQEDLNGIVGGLVNKTQDLVGRGVSFITPYVQAIQGLAGAVADRLPQMLNMDSLTSLIDPVEFINTVLNAILKIAPDIMTKSISILTELSNGTLGPDEQLELAKNPIEFIIKKVGWLVFFLLLAYGAKRYAEKHATNSKQKEELQKTQDEFQKNASGLE
jgi:hypothetical protein